MEAVVDYAIFQLDPSGNVATWNPGAERIKGYRPEEIIGWHFSTFYTHEDLERGVPKAALAEATEKGRFEAEGGSQLHFVDRYMAAEMKPSHAAVV